VTNRPQAASTVSSRQARLFSELDDKEIKSHLQLLPAASLCAIAEREGGCHTALAKPRKLASSKYCKRSESKLCGVCNNRCCTSEDGESCYPSAPVDTYILQEKAAC
jgi:hypothetical protein